MQARQRAPQDIPILDRVNQDFLDQLAAESGPPIYTLTPDEARSVLFRARSGFVRKPDAQVKDWDVVSGPYVLRLRTIRSEHANAIDRGPVIIYFHGAGWVMGDATTHDRLVRELAVGANATVVFVDYQRIDRKDSPRTYNGKDARRVFGRIGPYH
jgi:acetyl esterase